MKDSFFIGNTTGIVETDVFPPIMRAWHLIWKYAVVFEHSGLASEPCVCFWSARIAALTPLGHQRAPCIQPEVRIGSESTSLKEAGCLPLSPCSVKYRPYYNFYASTIHSSAPSTVTLTLSLCLLERETWCIQEAEDKHGYQVPTLVKWLPSCGTATAWVPSLTCFAGGYPHLWPHVMQYSRNLCIGLIGGHFLFLLIKTIHANHGKVGKYYLV